MNLDKEAEEQLLRDIRMFPALQATAPNCPVHPDRKLKLGIRGVRRPDGTAKDLYDAKAHAFYCELCERNNGNRYPGIPIYRSQLLLAVEYVETHPYPAFNMDLFTKQALFHSEKLLKYFEALPFICPACGQSVVASGWNSNGEFECGGFKHVPTENYLRAIFELVQQDDPTFFTTEAPNGGTDNGNR